MLARKTASTSARRSSADIFFPAALFFERRRSQCPTISAMSEWLGFVRAFCSLDHSFCSFFVGKGFFVPLKGFSSDVSFLTNFFFFSTAPASPPPPPRPPSALRFLLSFPRLFLAFGAAAGSGASATPMGFTESGPGPGRNFAWRRSRRFVAAPPPEAFIARAIAKARAPGRRRDGAEERRVRNSAGASRLGASERETDRGARGGVRGERTRGATTQRRRRDGSRLPAPESFLPSRLRDLAELNPRRNSKAQKRFGFAVVR